MRWPFVGREEERRRCLRALTGDHGGLLCGGPAGIGKTCLAHTCLDAVARDGAVTLRLSATASGAEMPLSAFAPVLTVEDAADQRTALPRVLGRLDAVAAGAPLVVHVDDAHLLDPSSAAVVRLLAETGRATVLLTARARSPLPEDLDRLWTSRRLDRIDLGPLPRSAVAPLLEAALDGVVSATTEAELWRLSGGNPLRLRELVGAGLDHGVLRRRHGIVQHEGSLAQGPRLEALVEQGLGPLDAQEREAVELLAVAGPLGLDEAEQLLDRPVLTRLEQAGVVLVEGDGRPRLRLARPLDQEMTLARLPRGRYRDICRRLVDEVGEHAGSRGAGDTRSVLWRLDAGDRLSTGELVEAARRARAADEVEQAVRFANKAAEQGGFEGQLALAEALTSAERREEAEAAFAAAEGAAVEQHQRLQATMSRAQNLLLGVHRPQAALRVLRDARAVCTDSRLREELLAMEATFASYAGDLQAAIDIAEELVDEPGVSDRAVLSTLTISSLALSMLGRAAEAVEAVARGRPLVAPLREELPLAGAQLGYSHVQALCALGRVVEAEQVARDAYNQAVQTGTGHHAGLCAVTLGVVLLDRGDVAEAARHLADGVLALEEQDPVGVLPGCLALEALANAMLGRASEAEERLALLDRRYRSDQHRFPAWRGRAAAWTAAVQGDLAGARRHALEAAAWAERHQQRLWAVWARHDLVRLGLAREVRGELDRAAREMDGAYVHTAARHAAAQVDGDADELRDVSARFEELGFTLIAAEASGQAADLHRRAGETDAATRAAGQLRRLARDCPGASTPALQEAPPDLTARELEVARLAARGLTSPAIAERLTISTRTVDNHLHRVYRKLGIHGRVELADLM